MDSPFRLWLKEMLHGAIVVVLLLLFLASVLWIASLKLSSNVLVNLGLKLGMLFVSGQLLGALLRPRFEARSKLFQKRKSWCSHCKAYGVLDHSSTSTHQEEYTHYWTEQVSNGGRYGNDGPQTDTVSRSEKRTREVETTHLKYSCRLCGGTWEVDC